MNLFATDQDMGKENQMNERQQLEVWYHDNVNKHADFYKPQYSDNYHKKHIQDCWYSWQSSASREGYKLVPVELIERCISHIGIASCHPANNMDDDIQMSNDIDALEKVITGTYSANKE